MSLRDKSRAAAKASDKSRKRNIITVPMNGEQVEVLCVGLLTGEKDLLMEKSAGPEGQVLFTQYTPLACALGARDPETEAHAWNRDSLEDMEELRALDSETTYPIRDEVLRLSGMTAAAVAEGNGEWPTTSTPSSSTLSAAESVAEP